MPSGLQGDTTRLSDPEMLEGILSREGAIVVTDRRLPIMSMPIVVPILMSCLTLTLNYPAVRRTNLVVGVFFAAFDFVFLGLAVFLQ